MSCYWASPSLVLSSAFRHRYHHQVPDLRRDGRRWSTSDCDTSSLSHNRKRTTLLSILPAKDEERATRCNRFPCLGNTNQQQSQQQADGDISQLLKPERSAGAFSLPGTSGPGTAAAGSQSQPPSLLDAARMRKELQKQHIGMKTKPSGVSHQNEGPDMRFSKPLSHKVLPIIV